MKRIITFLTVLMFCFVYPFQAEAATSAVEIPSGFELIRSSVGVKLYRKVVSGGYPDYVQLVKLNHGAAVIPLHGDLLPGSEPGTFGGVDNHFTSRPIQAYWNNLAKKQSRLFCVTSGQFFYMLEYPTRLPFPLKVNGNLVTGGYSRGEFAGQKMMIELWSDHAILGPLTKDTIKDSSAPNIIAGLSEDARKSPDKFVGRTFLGVDDGDGDGLKETVLIYSTQAARQADAAGILRQFGADEVMMLDGGLSTQIVCQGSVFIETERIIPQALAILDGTRRFLPPRPTPTPSESGLQKLSQVNGKETNDITPGPLATKQPDVEVSSQPVVNFANPDDPELSGFSFVGVDGVWVIPLFIGMVSIALFWKILTKPRYFNR